MRGLAAPTVLGVDWREVRATYPRLEEIGYDGVFSFEAKRVKGTNFPSWRNKYAIAFGIATASTMSPTIQPKAAAAASTMAKAKTFALFIALLPALRVPC